MLRFKKFKVLNRSELNFPFNGCSSGVLGPLATRQRDQRDKIGKYASAGTISKSKPKKDKKWVWWLKSDRPIWKWVGKCSFVRTNWNWKSFERSKQSYCKMSKVTPYRCFICDKSFDENWNAWVHVELHRSTVFYCDSCGKWILAKYWFVKHYTAKIVKKKNLQNLPTIPYMIIH